MRHGGTPCVVAHHGGTPWWYNMVVQHGGTTWWSYLLSPNGLVNYIVSSNRNGSFYDITFTIICKILPLFGLLFSLIHQTTLNDNSVINRI